MARPVRNPGGHRYRRRMRGARACRPLPNSGGTTEGATFRPVSGAKGFLFKYEVRGTKYGQDEAQSPSYFVLRTSYFTGGRGDGDSTGRDERREWGAVHGAAGDG